MHKILDFNPADNQKKTQVVVDAVMGNMIIYLWLTNGIRYLGIGPGMSKRAGGEDPGGDTFSRWSF